MTASDKTRSRKISDPSSGTSVVRAQTTADGREIWHVVSDGQRRTIATSSSSATAMDEAVVLYADALKRLATR